MMKRAILGAAALALVAAATGPEFAYRYPAQAGAIPALKAKLDGESARLKAKLLADDAAARREAAKGGLPYHSYSSTREWKVVVDTPRYLSLSQEGYDYTGGAHGMPTYGALVWDKVRRGGQAPIAWFDRAKLRAAIRRPFCAAIDRQRAAKRGEPVKPGSEDPFDQCIDPTGQTLLLGSASRRGFDRIGVVVAPYEAGPFAEGKYEVTLPVTPAVLAAVRAAYRGAFAVGR